MFFISRSVPDLNNMASLSASLFQSMGEACHAFPPASRPSTTRSRNSDPSTSRSSSVMTEGLPEELHSKFFEWLRRKNDGSESTQLARRGGLTPNKAARRHEVSAAARRQRSTFLHIRCDMPRSEPMTSGPRHSELSSVSPNPTHSV